MFKYRLYFRASNPKLGRGKVTLPCKGLFFEARMQLWQDALSDATDFYQIWTKNLQVTTHSALTIMPWLRSTNPAFKTNRNYLIKSVLDFKWPKPFQIRVDT